MSLRAASRMLRDLPQIRAINDHFGSLTEAPPQRVSLVSLPPAARAPLMAALLAGQTETALIVTSRADRADSIALSLSEYLPPDRPVHVWPAPEAMPYDQLPFDGGLAAERVALLAQLNAGRPDAPAAIVVTVRGLVQIVMGASELKRQTLVIRVGRRLRIDDVVTWAMTVGYSMVPLVNEPGTLARRGGIVDIFVPGTALPFRLDFFGDEVDSLRTFDPHTQRSHQKLDQATLLPPTELPLWRADRALPALRALDDRGLRDEIRTEWRRMIERVEHAQMPASVDLLAPYLVPERSTILDYVSRDALVLIEEPQAVELAAASMITHAGEVQVSALSNGELPPGLQQPFADWPAIETALSQRHRISFGSAPGSTEIDIPALDDAPLFAGRIDAMVDAIDQRRSQGWSVYLASGPGRAAGRDPVRPLDPLASR